jgi:ATP-dependent exoDNAse (exonuclease V) beta subunit
LFYVALTRAAEHLLITHCATRGGRTVQPSRWLDAVITTAARDAPVPPPPRPRTAKDPLVPYREWRTAVARVSGQPDTAVCNDRVLRSLREQPPLDAKELAQRLGITESAAARLRPLPQPSAP